MLSLWCDGRAGHLEAFPASGEPWGSVIVAPGGAYARLAPHEGAPVARWLAGLGLDAYVLHYRHGAGHRHPAPLEDAQQALRFVRARSERPLAMLGFSAGGHLTALTCGSSVRPDLAILIYPVIVMLGKRAHQGCIENLLGHEASDDSRGALSAQRGVDSEHPPTFIVHTLDDVSVPHEHSVIYAGALRKVRVPHELHLFESGPHGFGLGESDASLAQWPELCEKWLHRHWR